MTLNLVDQVRFSPQIGSYNIYIIDDAHVISSDNVFLKTLEEPPNHAIFILATAEKHKIIPTILSRARFLILKVYLLRILYHILSTYLVWKK